ncbi:MAG TPA: hypothetical protein VI977_06805 [archaeon]|nr:hypothetical protein [archaeon]
MRVLVPLLSKHENNEFFLQNILDSAKEIVLLLVIDTQMMPGQFGFAASDIATGNALLQELKKFFVKKRRLCLEIEEWGNTESKILQTAQMKSVDRIFFAKQNNDFYFRLVSSIRSKTKIPIEEIKVPFPEKK